MTLAEFRRDYQHFSGKASDITRQVAFSGIAAVWILKAGGNGVLSTPLRTGLFLFTLALGLDLLHALYGSVAWGVFCRRHELKGAKESDELTAPSWINWPTEVLFWAKIAFALAGVCVVATFQYDMS